MSPLISQASRILTPGYLAVKSAFLSALQDRIQKRVGT
jgi:hypothetical protein